MCLKQSKCSSWFVCLPFKPTNTFLFFFFLSKSHMKSPFLLTQTMDLIFMTVTHLCPSLFFLGSIYAPSLYIHISASVVAPTTLPRP